MDDFVDQWIESLSSIVKPKPHFLDAMTRVLNHGIKTARSLRSQKRNHYRQIRSGINNAEQLRHSHIIYHDFIRTNL